ncbi:putative Pre-mRNA 3'-end-processing factor FIP1 [Hypsibius exemplaris]|uniref:Pre-mRNA 3'-end-processing factor FIP1 n=1 Tax=Hypsibius exemplaris TaxID=2072580 RepID=A0A9X6RNC8_HYPEX|nr:putative Pre-mRNA 3'-end-processing factor FIP1 [Hypsibius exemplaris]
MSSDEPVEVEEVEKKKNENETSNEIAAEAERQEEIPVDAVAEAGSADSAGALESGELAEPATKKAKLDVLVPENYEDEEEDFPDEWKGEGEEDEEEGFEISIDDVNKPRIDFRKNFLNKKNVDFSDIPEINGVPVNEFNIDNLEDKPWKKPGADIADYFNYGFTEDTWKMYCDKQRRMRNEAHDMASQITTLKNDNSKYKDTPGQSSQAPPPFRAQFRRRPGPEGGPSLGNFERPSPMMMPMPGMPFLPGMMHPGMNMMMRPGMMGRMDDRGRQDHQRTMGNMPQYDSGMRRQLTTVVRIDTSGNTDSAPPKDS